MPDNRIRLIRSCLPVRPVILFALPGVPERAYCYPATNHDEQTQTEPHKRVYVAPGCWLLLFFLKIPVLSRGRRCAVADMVGSVPLPDYLLRLEVVPSRAGSRSRDII